MMPVDSTRNPSLTLSSTELTTREGPQTSLDLVYMHQFLASWVSPELCYPARLPLLATFCTRAVTWAQLDTTSDSSSSCVYVPIILVVVTLTLSRLFGSINLLTVTALLPRDFENVRSR